MGVYRHSAHAVTAEVPHCVDHQVSASGVAWGYRGACTRGHPADPSVGTVDEQTIREYIENQQWDEDVEGFKITAPREP